MRGRGLGSWISPTDPTLGQQAGDVWILTHPVVNLAAPATYKFRVTFRWLGSDGQTLGTAIQSSPTCYQPEMRADLLVRSLSVAPITSGASAGQSAYIALIGNRGLTGAGPVQVEFADGATAPVSGDDCLGGAEVLGSRAVRGAGVHGRHDADRDRRPDADDRRVRLREQRADDALPGAGAVRAAG